MFAEISLYVCNRCLWVWLNWDCAQLMRLLEQWRNSPREPFPLCFHRYDGTQIWHLGPISIVTWPEEQIKQLVQSPANSWHPSTALMGKATDQWASVFGMKMLLVPRETAFPNKQNANAIWIFLIPGSKSLQVTFIFHYRSFPKISQSLFTSCASWCVSEQHCKNR